MLRTCFEKVHEAAEPFQKVRIMNFVNCNIVSTTYKPQKNTKWPVLGFSPKSLDVASNVWENYDDRKTLEFLELYHEESA
jgi:hypothetical protein